MSKINIGMMLLDIAVWMLQRGSAPASLAPPPHTDIERDALTDQDDVILALVMLWRQPKSMKKNKIDSAFFGRKKLRQTDKIPMLLLI